MIDHISLGVAELSTRAGCYESGLTEIGMKPLVVRESAVGYGKRYFEPWINRRARMPRVAADTGAHLGLWARSTRAVDAFHEAALTAGAQDDEPPGPRPQYRKNDEVAFARDPDGDRVEVATFLDAGAG